MRKSQKKSAQSKIEKVQKRFEQWRATRVKRNTPEELWQAAVELYPEYKISKIVEASGVNYSKLKRKILESQIKKESDQSPKKENKNDNQTKGSDKQSRIEKIRRELEDFRKGNKKRSRIPESIWQAAVELCLDSNPQKIAKALRLDYRSLKKRLNPPEKNTLPNSESPPSPVAQPRAPAFIQLDIPSPPKQAGRDQNEWSIEIENVDGAKMKIGVKSTQMLDIAVICQNFLRG